MADRSNLYEAPGGAFRRQKGGAVKPAIVKLTVDLYCPGAVLRQKETNWLFNWEKFHSRRILYPTMEPGMLTTVEDGVQIVVQDFCHIRLTAIDDGYWGILDSRLDGGLAGEGLELTLGEEIARISQAALLKAPRPRAVRHKRSRPPLR